MSVVIRVVWRIGPSGLSVSAGVQGLELDAWRSTNWPVRVINSNV